ncbi:MAG TPA: hypothetical protein VH418_13945 [Solirubrobacteraceae bacterium]|jgi:hypothetical protein
MESNEPDPATRPEQLQPGFGEGAEQEQRTPEERHVGDFAEGVEAHTPEEERVGRFSEGSEETPETPEKNLEGSFAEGTEADASDRYAEASEQASIREATDLDN